MTHKRIAKRHGPKPRYGETMVTVSIRLPQSTIDAIDQFAVDRGRTLNVAWCRTDEIRERLKSSFQFDARRAGEWADELRQARRVLERFLADTGGGGR